MDYKSIINKTTAYIKKYDDKSKLRRFYVEGEKEGKTYFAIILDKILFRGIIALVFLTAVFLYTGDILFSIFLTIQVFILYNMLAYRINKKKLEKTIIDKNEEVAKETILMNLLNKTNIEFVQYLKEILSKKGIEALEDSDKKDIDMIAKHGDRIIGFKFFQYNRDYKVSRNAIREFFLKLKEYKIEEGFIITTSSFSDDTNELMVKIEKHIDIKLIDFNRLIYLIKESGQYPSTKDIEKNIIKQIKEKRRKINEYRKVVLSKRKSLKYIFLGGMIYVFGFITPYTGYYRIVAYILLSLGILTLCNSAIMFFNAKSSSNDNKFI